MYDSIFLTILISISIVGTLQPFDGLESLIKLATIGIGHGLNDSECHGLSDHTILSVLL